MTTLSEFIEKAKELSSLGFTLYPSDDAGTKVRIVAVKEKQETMMSCDLYECYHFCQENGCRNIHSYLGII
jgi:hypothetical protein